MHLPADVPCSRDRRLRAATLGYVHPARRGRRFRSGDERWTTTPASAPRPPVTTLEEAARWFLRRGLSGELVNRRGATILVSDPAQLRDPTAAPGSAVRRPGEAERRLAQLPLEELTNRVAQALANHLAASASAATTRTAIAALQSVMREAYEAGVTEMERPTRLGCRARPSRASACFDLTRSRLLDAARTDDERFGRSFALPLIRLLWATGARVSEVLALEWGELGLDLRSDPPVMRIRESEDRGGRAGRLVGCRDREHHGPGLRGYAEAADRLAGLPARRRRACRPVRDRARHNQPRCENCRRVGCLAARIPAHARDALVADGASIVDITTRVGHADPRHTLSLYAKPTDAGQARIVRLLEAARSRARTNFCARPLRWECRIRKKNNCSSSSFRAAGR